MVTYSSYHFTKTPRPSKKEEVDLIKKSQNGDIEARDLLIVSHIWRVEPIARKYAGLLGHKTTYEELRDQGILGLFDAVDRFDSSMGVRFSTYAAIWIKEKIMRHVYEVSIVHIPTYLHKIHQKILRIEKDHLNEHMRKPTLEEIAVALSAMPSLDKKNVPIGDRSLNLASRALNTFRQSTFSLDEPLPSEEGETTYHDIVADNRASPIADNVSIREVKRDILEYALPKLPPREQIILKHRYGLDSAELLTLNTLGKMLQITGERVRQLQVVALRRLKRVLRRYKNE